MAATSIQWTDKTWNPVRGCEVVSPGCINCYAMKQAHRFSGPGRAYEGLTKLGGRGPIWTGGIRTVPEMLTEPLRWKTPARIFVNSMSDLFHEDVPNEFIAAVFGVMAFTPRHTYQVLTKRAERLPKWFAWLLEQSRGFIHGVQGFLHAMIERIAGREVANRAWNAAIKYRNHRHGEPHSIGDATAWPWPLPNVWIGVSVENQKHADERIPHLLKVPAAVRFLSVEPMIEEITLDPGRCDTHGIDFIGYDQDNEAFCTECAADDYSGELSFGHWLKDHDDDFSRMDDPTIDWVIVGGESGPKARPFHLDWARQIVKQCGAANVPVFVKQLGRQPQDVRAFRWVTPPPGTTLHGPGEEWLVGPDDRLSASVWPSGSWHTWDEDGIGGFNSYTSTIEQAKRDAEQAVVDQNWCPIHLKDSHGGDPSEWPEDLRVRQFPEVRRGA